MLAAGWDAAVSQCARRDWVRAHGQRQASADTRRHRGDHQAAYHQRRTARTVVRVQMRCA